jgi:hypothetical protein
MAAAGFPADHAFVTKPALALAQAKRALAAGIRPRWATGDEVYGRSAALREFCEVLAEYVPTVGELDQSIQYIVDGTLLPCWSWASCPALYSGKHKTTGMNVQVACTLTGHLAWISDPIDGHHHDSYCLAESGALAGADPGTWIGDKGYIGNDMLTPIRKPPTATCSAGRTNSTGRSIKSATSSSESSQTLRPGESCMSITGDLWDLPPNHLNCHRTALLQTCL